MDYLAGREGLLGQSLAELVARGVGWSADELDLLAVQTSAALAESQSRCAMCSQLSITLRLLADISRRH